MNFSHTNHPRGRLRRGSCMPESCQTIYDVHEIRLNPKLRQNFSDTFKFCSYLTHKAVTSRTAPLCAIHLYISDLIGTSGPLTLITAFTPRLTNTHLHCLKRHYLHSLQSLSGNATRLRSPIDSVIPSTAV